MATPKPDAMPLDPPPDPPPGPDDPPAPIPKPGAPPEPVPGDPVPRLADKEGLVDPRFLSPGPAAP